MDLTASLPYAQVFYFYLSTLTFILYRMPKLKKPLTLGIIIPAYNEEYQIEACLNHIANQTVMPDQVILVNNNSTDNTAQFAKKYRFVRVINEKKQGIVHARNAGFNACKSDIIGRIDADTWLPNDWVERVKQFYGNKKSADTAITGGGYFTNLVFPPDRVNGLALDLIAFRFNRLIMGHYILWGSNMAMHRSDWQKVKQYVCGANDIHEDLDLAIHLHQIGIKVKYVPSLIVGVKMKRVLDEWSNLFGNLMWWPRTLRRHGNWRWVFGMAGAYTLLIFSVALFLLNKPIIIIKKSFNGFFRTQTQEP